MRGMRRGVVTAEKGLIPVCLSAICVRGGHFGLRTCPAMVLQAAYRNAMRAARTSGTASSVDVDDGRQCSV